jgi:pyruvate kinase
MIHPRLPAVPPAPKRAEQDWAPWLRRTHPSSRASARNLVHYWALRQHDPQDLQQTLSAYGL